VTPSIISSKSFSYSLPTPLFLTYPASAEGYRRSPGADCHAAAADFPDRTATQLCIAHDGGPVARSSRWVHVGPSCACDCYGFLLRLAFAPQGLSSRQTSGEPERRPIVRLKITSSQKFRVHYGMRRCLNRLSAASQRCLSFTRDETRQIRPTICSLLPLPGVRVFDGETILRELRRICGY